MEKIIIVGAAGSAGIVHEAFAYDSPHSVAGFIVEERYLKSNEFNGLPVFALEKVHEIWNPEEHCFHVALGYYGLNRHRERLINLMSGKGYRPISYISSRAIVSPSAKIGTHCFVADGAIIQTNATLGNNVIFYGSTIGHDVVVGNNCFFAVGTLTCGYVQIGDYSYIGAGAVIQNDLTIGKDCVIGARAIVSENLPNDTLAKSKDCVYSPHARAIFSIWERGSSTSRNVI